MFSSLLLFFVCIFQILVSITVTVNCFCLEVFFYSSLTGEDEGHHVCAIEMLPWRVCFLSCFLLLQLVRV